MSVSVSVVLWEQKHKPVFDGLSVFEERGINAWDGVVFKLGVLGTLLLRGLNQWQGYIASETMGMGQLHTPNVD